MSLPLNGVKCVMVGGNQRDVEPLCQGSRKGLGKGNALFHLYDPDPLDKGIIGLRDQVQMIRLE